VSLRVFRYARANECEGKHTNREGGTINKDSAHYYHYTLRPAIITNYDYTTHCVMVFVFSCSSYAHKVDASC